MTTTTASQMLWQSWATLQASYDLMQQLQKTMEKAELELESALYLLDGPGEDCFKTARSKV